MKKVLAVALLMAAVESSSGCGLLDAASGIQIPIPDQTISFSVDANQLRSQLEQALGVSLAGQSQIPSQLNINETFNLDLPVQHFDVSDEQDLKKYIEAGKIKSVTVESVLYSIGTNSLNYSVPPLEVWLDELNATSIGASSKKIAQTNEIPAGQTVNGELQFVSGGRQILSDYLLRLKFAFLGRTRVTIDTNVSRAIPAGQLAGTVTIELYFTVDPI